MQGKISMDLSFCQSEEGFSLDELVSKLADVYERKAFSELLKMILRMVQVPTAISDSTAASSVAFEPVWASSK